MTADPVAAAGWVTRVHTHLAARATAEPGAAWGAWTVRHRTTRPDWYRSFADAWARPDPPGPFRIDLCSGSVAEAGAVVGPPPRSAGTVHLDRAAHDGTVTAWDEASGLAVVLRTDAPGEYEQVSPLRPLVHWTALAADGVLLHAAAIGHHSGPDRTRGLLVVGQAGFGKSTTTAAALGAGWVTAGDDAVLVAPADHGWGAQSVYGAVKTKLDGDHPDLPVTATRSWTVGGRKSVHLLTGTGPDRLAHHIDLVGIVVLDPTADPDAPVTPASGGRARTLAAPSTIGALPDRQADVLSRIGAVCGALPAFVLPRRSSLGRTVDDLTDVLERCDPPVGVVVPVHDGGAFVAEAIASVTAQTVGRCRIVVVDDASTDDSVAAVEATRPAVERAGHELCVLRSATNRGVGASRDRGVDAVGEPYVAFLDQDDLWTRDHLAVLLRPLLLADVGRVTGPGPDAVYGRVRFRDAGADVVRPWMRDHWFDGDHPGHDFGAGLFRRAAFDRVGPISDALGMFDDVDWYLRLRDSTRPAAVVDRVVLERRIHATNQSQHLARDADGLLGSVRAHLTRTRRAAIELDVVIPARNAAAFVGEAVASVLAQEQTDPRVVVVDDGSSDGTAELVESWNDPRVSVVRLGTPRGIGAARNAGIAQGERPWVSFLDADDLWPPDRTRRLAAAIADDPDALAVGRVHATTDPAAPVSDADRAAAPSAVLAGGILGRRTVLERIGAFDETLRVGEFVEWFARARRLGVREVPVPVLALIRRLHPDNTTRARRDEFRDYLRVVAMTRARTRSP